MIFRRAAGCAPAWLELAPWQPPGRGTRAAEVPAASIAVAAREVAELALRPPAGLTASILGHSMGAFVALEAARIMQEREAPPAVLVVVAARAPGDARLRGLIDLSDDGCLDYLTSAGGTPPEVLAEPDLVRRALPGLRWDLSLLRDYPVPGPDRLGCPIVALASADDQVAPAHAVAGWRHLTSGPFSLHLIPGGHFAIHERAEAWPLIFELLGSIWRRDGDAN